MWDLLYRAWRIVATCECGGQGRLACHRCLLPFAPPWQVEHVAREAAERHLRALLTAGVPDAAVPQACDWELTEEPPGVDTMESHLSCTSARCSPSE